MRRWTLFNFYVVLTFRLPGVAGSGGQVIEKLDPFD